MTDKKHEIRSICRAAGLACDVIIEHDGSRIMIAQSGPAHRPKARAWRPAPRTVRGLPCRHVNKRHARAVTPMVDGRRQRRSPFSAAGAAPRHALTACTPELTRLLRSPQQAA